MKITKKQLRRIIREEARKLVTKKFLNEDAQTPVTNANDHHWPRVDWSNVGELVDKWVKMEEDSFDSKDPSMTRGDDLSASEAKAVWKEQVDTASMDMEAELTNRIRKVALKTMQEYTDKLLNGEYS